MRDEHERDRDNAETILNYIENIRKLGSFAGENTRDQEITFIALQFRNERLRHYGLRPNPAQHKVAPSGC